MLQSTSPVSFQVIKGSLRGQRQLWKRQEEESCPPSWAEKAHPQAAERQGQQAWAHRSQDAWGVGYKGSLEPWEMGRGQQVQTEGYFCGAAEEGARRSLLAGPPLNFPFSIISNRKPRANHSYGKANSWVKRAT